MRHERKSHASGWIPKPGANRTPDAVQRRKLIRAWAPAGYSSRQMSERLGMAAPRIRQIARDMNIEIPADTVLGKSRRHDSGRIIRETVQALEGLAIGASLVTEAGLDAVDPADAKAWATSLTDSIQALTQFASQIKEMTQ